MKTEPACMMHGTWCDGLEGYLCDNHEVIPAWAYPDFGLCHAGLIIAQGDLVNRGPLTIEDRIYIMAHDVATNPVIPSWALVNIMQAMSEGRRVAIYAPTEAEFLGLYELVVHPGAMPAGHEPRPLAN